MSKIYLINGSTTRAVESLVTAHVRDSLDSEFTLSFTLTADDAAYINDSTKVQYNGQYFNVIGYDKDTDGQSPVCAVECEHISYELNNDDYALDSFAVTGTPAQLMTAALSGTPFTVGTVEPTQSYTVVINDVSSRRAVLYTVAAIVGGEIEYNGYSINLRNHRGSTQYIDLLGTYNVTHVSLSRSVRENLTSYTITLGRKTTLSAGDNVHIEFSPLGIDVNTRIIAIEYNPYNDYEVSIEVGDYVPDIVDSYASISEQIKGVKQEFTVSNGELTSRITTAEGNISTLQQTATSLTSTIQTANGNISTLQQTVSTLTSKISTAEGDISSLEQTATSLTTRIENAEGNILTVYYTADKVNWLISSGTTSSNFQMTSRAISLVAANINLSGYVTFSDLSNSGSTTINGSNITTGTLNASLIAANNGIYIQFPHAIMTDSVFGLDSLYFGEFGYITKIDATENTPLCIYSYQPPRFMYNNPVLYMYNNGSYRTYEFINAYNISNYISSSTATFG